MNWRQRGYKILSVFFYGYSGGLPAVGGFIAFNDPTNLTLFNLAVFPLIAGYIATIPQLGKIFGELSNARKNKE